MRKMPPFSLLVFVFVLAMLIYGNVENKTLSDILAWGAVIVIAGLYGLYKNSQ